MNIIITGSLGNISRPLTEQLISEGHAVTIISSTLQRRTEIEELGGKAAIGTLSDANFLARAFEGADAVYAMTPTVFTTPDIINTIKDIGLAYAKAIKAAQVKRVVMLSSIGSDLPEGTGPLKALHSTEELLRKIDGTDTILLRAGFFYYNYFGNIPTIRQSGILGSNYPADTRLPLVHPEDIANAAAYYLTIDQTSKGEKYIISDIYSAAEVAASLGAAIGKPELQWTAILSEQFRAALMSVGITESTADAFVEMGEAIGSGSVCKDYFLSGAPVSGHRKFSDFTKVFADAYNAA